MDSRIKIAKLILVLFSLSTVVAQDWALLRVNKDKTTQSRALKWLPKNGIKTMEDAVVAFTENSTIAASEDDAYIKKEPISFFICRIRDPRNGEWLLGTVCKSIEVCKIRLSASKILPAVDYEVLNHVNGAEQLSWQNIQFHDQHAVLPPNVVSVDENYIIAHMPISISKTDTEKAPIGRSHWVFKMDQSMSSPWIEFGDQNYLNLDGIAQVLVVTEPVSYKIELLEVVNNPNSNLWLRALKLGEVTLHNTDYRSKTVESVIPYHRFPNNTWISNETIPVGANTTILMNLPNLDGKFSLSWGIQNEETRDEFYRVSAFLPADTGVNITLQANVLILEDTFVGTLRTVYNNKYEDDSRPISVVRRRTIITDLESVYSSMFHLTDNPTTTSITKSPTEVISSAPVTTWNTNSITVDKSSSPLISSNTSPSPSSTGAVRPTTTTTITFPAPTTSTLLPKLSTLGPIPKPQTPVPTSMSPNTTTSTPASNTTTAPPHTTTTIPYPTTSTPASNTTTAPPHTTTTILYPTTSTPASNTTTAPPHTTTTIPYPTTSPAPPKPTTTSPTPITTTSSPTTITTTTSPAPITSTTPSNFVDFDMTLFLKLKMKIPVK